VSVSTIYALFAAGTSMVDARAVTDAVVFNGGTLTTVLQPRLAVVDGDDTVAAALQDLVGAQLAAVGVDDVSPLAFAADTTELVEQVGMLALTTPTAEQTAEFFRPRAGQGWTGFGCEGEE
jgi:hypothetical protein